MTTDLATADAPQLEQQGSTLARTIDALQVTTPETYVEAGHLLLTVAAYIKRVGEIMDPVVTAAHHAHQVALQQRAKLLGPAETAKRTLGQRRTAYEQEIERQRREAEAVRQREQERLEAAERTRVAAEQRRLQAEAEERQLAEAAAAEAVGDAELAERIVSERQVVELPAPRPVLLPPVSVPTLPRVAGVSSRESWRAEVTDLMVLVKAVAAGIQPITLVEANMVALNGLARSLKQAMRVPGVRAKNDPSTSTRVG